MIDLTTYLKPRKVCYVFFIAFFLCFHSVISADNIKSFNKQIEDLDKIDEQLRNEVLSLLTLIKELEKNGPAAGSRIAKIIYPEEPVKEANLPEAKSIFMARYNEQFIILDQQDDWLKIRLVDGREGWINREAVQVIVRDNKPNDKSNNLEVNELLIQMSIIKEDIEHKYLVANDIIIKTELLYDKFSSNEKSTYKSVYQKFTGLKEKINKYYAYANKFLQPYSGLLIAAKPKVKNKAIASQKRFSGRVYLEFGKTIQNTRMEESGFSGNLDFMGEYRLNNVTSITGGIRHQEEVIRTPFATTRGNVGIKNHFRNGVNLNADIGYDDYNDKFDDVNDFNLLNASANLTVPFGKGSVLNGYIGHSERKYKNTLSNGFSSTRYQVSAFIKNNPKLSANIFLNGNLQTSVVDYLKFDQLNPGFIITKRREHGKSFITFMDVNMYSYKGEAERNNFSRGRLNFKWMGNKKGKNKTSFLGFIGKLYPNHDRLNYLRAHIAFSGTKGNLAKGRTRMSTFRSIYTYYTLRDTSSLVDYMDLRYDLLKKGKNGFVNFNAFSRLFNTINRDINIYNTLDIYLTAGPVIHNRKSSNNAFELRIGPIVSSHILAGPENMEFWDNNGTSFRGGLALQGEVFIKSASVRFMGSYERQFLIAYEYTLDPKYGELFWGEKIVRKPNSIQFNMDFRMPVARAWEVHFNVNHYDIVTDAIEGVKTKPSERNMRLRIVGGVAYRFIL